MSLSKTWNGVTYTIPENTETGWGSQVTAFLAALADNAATTVTQKFAVRVATTSPVTVSTTTDCIIMTNLASAGAVTVNLPAGSTGKIIGVVDQKGDAGTNNITIDGNGSETINGSTTYVINANRGGVLLAWSGGEWVVISDINSKQLTDLTVQDTAANSPIITAKTTDSVSGSGQSAAYYATDNSTIRYEAGLTKQGANSVTGYFMLGRAGGGTNFYHWYDSSNAMRVSTSGSNLGSTTSSAWNFGVGIQLPSGGSPSTLDHYEESAAVSTTFTFNGSGGTSSSVNFFFRRIGKIVVVEVPTILATTGTGSTTFTSGTGFVPSQFRPRASCYFPVLINQGGSTLASMGNFLITTAGTITVFKDGTSAAWTNSAANSGTATQTDISYII